MTGIGIIDRALQNPLIMARAQNYLRMASMAAGAWTLSHMYDWMAAHMAYLSTGDAQAIAGTVSAFVAGLILTVGSALLSNKDVTKVDAKLNIAAATGDIKLVNDKATVKAVAANVTAKSGTQEAVAQTAQIVNGQ